MFIMDFQKELERPKQLETCQSKIYSKPGNGVCQHFRLTKSIYVKRVRNYLSKRHRDGKKCFIIDFFCYFSILKIMHHKNAQSQLTKRILFFIKNLFSVFFSASSQYFLNLRITMQIEGDEGPSLCEQLQRNLDYLSNKEVLHRRK